MNKEKLHLSRSPTCKKQAKGLQLQEHDWLSSLPDSLLVSILSLLSVEEAAKTCVLSHRWTHLWTQISRLDLYHLPKEGKSLSFISTVNHIFEQLTSNKIQTFHLRIPHLFQGNNNAKVRHFVSALEKWLGRVCALNVEDIKLSGLHWVPNICLPTSTLICPSLVVLELNGRCHLQLPDDGIIRLPNLNRLELHGLEDWDCQTMSKLFKSCPALEVLDLDIDSGEQGHRIIDVSCEILRSLKINVWNRRQGWDYIINAPKLEMFDVNSLVSSFRFVENPCLLTEAKIKWVKSEDSSVDILRDQMSALVQGICSVKSLVLVLTSIPPLYPLVHLDENILPTFHNLSDLHIHLNHISLCTNLLRFFNRVPNVEVLYIDKDSHVKGVEWDVPDSIPLCLSRKIKKFEVMGLEGSKEDLKFLKYILGNANVLKSVLVGISSHSTSQIGKEARFCKNLFTSSRSSKACVIAFQGRYLHASSTDNHSCARLKCEIEL